MDLLAVRRFFETRSDHQASDRSCTIGVFPGHVAKLTRQPYSSEDQLPSLQLEEVEEIRHP